MSIYLVQISGYMLILNLNVEAVHLRLSAIRNGIDRLKDTARLKALSTYHRLSYGSHSVSIF